MSQINEIVDKIEVYELARDLKPTEELFFSLTITPLSTFSTPSLSK